MYCEMHDSYTQIDIYFKVIYVNVCHTGQSNEHLDTSATSINSFNLQGRASTNASLQSLDMSYPHHSISADDSYLSSSAHRELSRFDDSSHPSMVVSSIGSLSSHHSRSSSADYNDLRGELRGTQFGDQRMGAGEVYCSHWWCVYWGLQPE